MRVRRVGVHRNVGTMIGKKSFFAEARRDELLGVPFGDVLRRTQFFTDPFEGLPPDAIHAAACFEMPFELRLGPARLEILHQVRRGRDLDTDAANQFYGPASTIAT